MFEHGEVDRYCACGARNPRARAKSCRSCGAAASRRSYERKKHTIALRRQKRGLSTLDRQSRNARAYLAMYVKRGKVVVGPCETCGTSLGRRVPVQPDPRSPLDARWFCVAHYRDFRIREAALSAAEAEEAGTTSGGGWRIADPVQYASKRECFEVEYPKLPATVAEQLRALAARKLPGIVLSDQSPLFKSALISVFDQFYRGELKL